MGEGGSTAIATGATVRSTESIDYLLAEMLGNTNFSDVGNRIVTPDIASFLNISPYKHMAFDLRLVSEKGGRISKGNNFLVYESKTWGRDIFNEDIA